MRHHRWRRIRLRTVAVWGFLVNIYNCKPGLWLDFSPLMFHWRMAISAEEDDDFDLVVLLVQIWLFLGFGVVGRVGYVFLLEFCIYQGILLFFSSLPYR